MIARALAIIALAASLAAAEPSLVDGLATDDPRALATAVTAIEHAPPAPELGEALFAAARACEDRLLDPARALALYERILRDAPDARVATAAAVRARQLRATLGPHAEYGAEAAAFAQLVAHADAMSLEELIVRADALAAMPWPGAPDVALWTADVMRRVGLAADAQRRYADIERRWPERTTVARRGGAGAAIDAHDWTRAEELVSSLQSGDDTDGLIRENLRADLDTARRSARRYTAAWIALVLALAGLAASLAEAVLRGGRRRPSWRPPVEVMFLAPVAILLAGVAFLTRAMIAPAILQITACGIATAWLSGITLDLLRARGRHVRLRSIAHAIACGAAAISIGYIAIVHGGLVELLQETVQAGPGG